MKIIDPGHKYELNHLDGNSKSILTFVKREGTKYPGNIGNHEGTNIQEVLRALINRIKYLNNQNPDFQNDNILKNLRNSIWCLEHRAARRHNRPIPYTSKTIELDKFCENCGHIGCNNNCVKLKLDE